MIGSDLRSCPQCGQALRPTALFCPQCGTAVMPSVSNALQISIAQILASVKPGKAEVIRRCAIPRWFDSDIMAVLRDRNDGANESILAQLADYSFVRQLSENRYAYSDDVRSLMLDDWRQRPDELRPIQKRLYQYFERRMGSTTNENRATWLREIVTYDLLLASTTAAKDQQQSSDNPWIMTQTTVAARIQRALLRFRSLIESALNAHRLAEAEAILVAAEEQADILAPLVRDWLIYYRGRLYHANVRLDEAIVQYQHLLNSPDVDPELCALTAISLGDVQVENSQWAPAIVSYKTALALPDLEPTQEAEAHVGLGDAYNEIAVSSGGWHVPPQSQNTVVRWVARGFWIMAMVPMLILVTALRRLGAAVPPAAILVRYQNWLLARIFRASREEIQAAYAIYKQRDDDTNMARCELRLLEIDVLFGSVKAAVAVGEGVLGRRSSADIYRLARAQVGLSRALLADGQCQRAQEMAEEALKIFRSLDDGRWETRAQTALGNIHLAQNNDEQALLHYKEGLERARAIGSVLSRERILYELRTWRRQRAGYPPEIDRLLNNEPNQRFVARFPRFLLPYLQIGQSVIIPSFFILTAIIAPSQQQEQLIQTSSNLLLPAPSVYVFPWYRLIIAPLLIALAIAVCYALLGLLVLWRLPLSKLQENAPDILRLGPDGIEMINEKGAIANKINWANITTIASADRTLWRRPMPVFSRFFLEAGGPPLLRIEGSMSWYNTVCATIRNRAKAAGAKYASANYNISLLRSKGGIMLIIGALLTATFISSVNGWLPDLAALLPPTAFAALQLLAYSGILMIAPMINWTVLRPLRLRREFELDNRMTMVIAGVGFAIVLLFLVTNGTIVRVPIFSINLFMAGVFLLTESSYQLGVRQGKNRRWRAVSVVVQLVMMAVALYGVSGPILREFYHARSHAYTVQGNSEAALIDRFNEVNQDTLLFSKPMQLEEGAALLDKQDWDGAAKAYQAVIASDFYSESHKALAYHSLAVIEQERCQQQRCNPTEAQSAINHYEDEAFNTLQHAVQNGKAQPNDVADLLQAQAASYLKLGDKPRGLDKLEGALNWSDDPLQRQSIEQQIDTLR